MPVAGALAKKCDYPLVIVQCAFRSQAADDPKAFSFVNYESPVDKVYGATRRGFLYFYRQPPALNIHDPYAKPKEQNIRRAPAEDPPRVAVCGNREHGANVSGEASVAAERRAIKKAARRHLKEQLLREVDERDWRILHNNYVAASLREACCP